MRRVEITAEDPLFRVRERCIIVCETTCRQRAKQDHCAAGEIGEVEHDPGSFHYRHSLYV
jgi:hypothetical protein